MIRGHRVTALTFTVTLALLAATCARPGGSDDSSTTAPAAASASAPRYQNVILIVIDTLRADHLPSYGYQRNTAPFLSRLAHEGVQLHSYSSSSWTRPSTATILTGLYPQRHNANDRNEALPPTTPFLPETLSAQGVACRAYVVNGNVGATFGFDRGYEKFVEYSGGGKPDAPEEMEAARSVMTGLRAPFFVYLHLIDPHDPYVPHRPWPDESRPKGEPEYQPKQVRNGEVKLGPEVIRRMVDDYDAEIRELDDQLEPFFTWLDESGLLDDTLVVITSEHGEEFGEHGGVAHGVTLYEESVEVPLILWSKDGELPHVPESTMLDQVDLFPTLAQAQGIEKLPSGIDGLPRWADLCAGTYHTPADQYLYLDLDNVKLLGLRRGDEKVVIDLNAGKAEAFDLAHDPAEQHPLPAARLDELRSMQRDMVAFNRSLRDRSHARLKANAAGATKKQLKALGYLN